MENVLLGIFGLLLIIICLLSVYGILLVITGEVKYQKTLKINKKELIKNNLKRKTK